MRLWRFFINDTDAAERQGFVYWAVQLARNALLISAFVLVLIFTGIIK